MFIIQSPPLYFDYCRIFSPLNAVSRKDVLQSPNSKRNTSRVLLPSSMRKTRKKKRNKNLKWSSVLNKNSLLSYRNRLQLQRKKGTEQSMSWMHSLDSVTK